MEVRVTPPSKKRWKPSCAWGEAVTFSFDRVAGQYDETRGYPPGVAAAICDWVVARCNLDPAHSRLLETGVGTGRIALPFVTRGFAYTGLDVATGMLDRLQEKVRDLPGHRLEVVQGDVLTAALPAGAFDLILAVHFFHLIDLAAALPRYKAWLRPGGMILRGHDHREDDSPRQQVRRRYREALRRLGWQGAVAADRFHDREVEAILAGLGGEAGPWETVTAWTTTGTLAQAIANLERRLWSSTFTVPADLHQQACQEVRAWAESQFGDLEQPFADRQAFRASLIRFNWE